MNRVPRAPMFQFLESPSRVFEDPTIDEQDVTVGGAGRAQGAGREGSAPGRAAGRCRRGRRRSHVGRKAGSDGVRHPLGRWTQWKHGDSRCRQETRGSLPPTGSRGSQRRRCDRSDDAVGTQDRGDIPPALPRPRRDGAALLHRARAAGCVRGVVWLAGAGSGPGHCRGGHGATAREGDSSQPLPRWRLRPAARA